MKKFIKSFANTDSEWDSTTFFLIELTHEVLDKLKYYIKLTKGLLGHNDISLINVNTFTLNGIVGFFVDDYDYDIDASYCGVIELETIDNLIRPEQTVRDFNINIDRTNLEFVGYGKHTGEKFYSNIPIKFILSLSLPKETKTLFQTDYVIYDKANDQPLADSYGRILLFGDIEEADDDCCGNEMVISCTELPQHWQDEILKQINK